MDFFLLATVVLILLPYLGYTLAFKHPRSLSRFLTQKQLVELSQWMRLCSALCAVPTMYRAGINNPGLCIGIPFAIVGQYLSELVFCLIGDAGVYYGIELATVKPRKLSGFPFNISDPMYRGSLLTVIAFLLFFNATRDGIMLVIMWTLAYFNQICVENTEPGNMVAE